jgi:hypothetical protein
VWLHEKRLTDTAAKNAGNEPLGRGLIDVISAESCSSDTAGHACGHGQAINSVASLISASASLFGPQSALMSLQNSLLFSPTTSRTTHCNYAVNGPCQALLKPESREISLIPRPVRAGLPAQPIKSMT